MNRTKVAVNSMLAVAVIALGIVSYRAVKSDDSTTTSTSTTAAASTGIVLSSVSATGNVEAATEMSLSFIESGTITEINVKAGDRVEAGQQLARVDDGSQRSTLASAQASLASAEAQRQKLKTGQTPAERAQDAASVTEAKVSVTSAETSLENTRASTETNKVVLQAAVDQAKSSLDSATNQARLDTIAAQASVDQAKAPADTAAADLTSEQATLATDRSLLSSGQVGADPSASTAEGITSTVARYQRDQELCEIPQSPPDNVSCSRVASLLRLALEVQSQEKAVAEARAAATSATNELTNAQISLASTKATGDESAGAARNSLTNAQHAQLAGLQADQQSVVVAQRDVESSKASYASTVAGTNVKAETPTPAALAEQDAQVATAQADVDSAQRSLDDTVLRAPVAGTVSKISSDVGEASSSAGSSSSSSSSTTTSTSSGFITLTDLTGLQVKAGFSEADAAKIRVGLATEITLDALPGVELTGTVVALDTTHTLLSNVVTYYATITIDDPPAELKPGQTAAVSVIVDKAENVVTLPSSAVPGTGYAANLTVRVDGKREQRDVAIGLRGDDTVEITSGLKAGDKVVVVSGSSTEGATFDIGGAGLGG